jgi:hypothetical protein
MKMAVRRLATALWAVQTLILKTKMLELFAGRTMPV